MAKREKYQSTIRCLKCGAICTATYSENENPVFGNGVEKKIESVSHGFRIELERIICGNCNLPIQ